MNYFTKIGKEIAKMNNFIKVYYKFALFQKEKFNLINKFK